MALRKKYKDEVLEKHGIKLGFMGAFLKASSAALMEVPAVNARIEGENIVYSDYSDISVAVSTPKGLVTPVLRNTENLSIIQLEQALAALGKKVLIFKYRY
jgi:2-oxoglutarate dehydrogenase E2 component (dihydrolipoamide succinyltransferase)